MTGSYGSRAGVVIRIDCFQHPSPLLSPLATGRTLKPRLQSHSAAQKPLHESGLHSHNYKHSRVRRSAQSAGNTPSSSSPTGSVSLTPLRSSQMVFSPPAQSPRAVPPIFLLQPLLPTQGGRSMIERFARRSKPLSPPILLLLASSFHLTPLHLYHPLYYFICGL